MSVDEIFTLFQGAWIYHRTITNQKNTVLSGDVKGTAKFSLIQENELCYNEQGEFTLQNGSQFKIHQIYTYLNLKKENKIEKYFIQNNNRIKLFYTLKLENPFSEKIMVRHVCINDIYEATYHFFNQNHNKFELTYQVKGPKKEYLSITEYIKCND